MKYLLIVSLFVLPFKLQAQQKTNKIGTVEELNIYGKDAKVIIGKVIIENAADLQIYLLKANQEKDTDGNYKTIFYFGNPQNKPIYNVKIAMLFSKPVISVNYVSAGTNVMEEGLSNENKIYKTSYGEMKPLMSIPPSSIYAVFTILSKEKVLTNVYGASGMVP